MDRRSFLKATGIGSMALISGTCMSSCKSEPTVLVSGAAGSAATVKIDKKTGMPYRRLGRTGITVSAVALGCEGFGNKDREIVKEEFDYAISRGINFIDIYSSNPELRSNIGYALKGRRKKFVIQGHIGSCWSDGQYLRSRDVNMVKEAFEDELDRLGTNYIDVGMIHYVDDSKDYEKCFTGDFFDYVQKLKRKNKIRCIGLSTHNVNIASRAAEEGIVDVIMFSLNPAYDLVFSDGRIKGTDKDREHLFELCEANGVALDVMKAFAGGNLLSAEDSPFGRALTPAQCIEYALTRPAVAAVMCGCNGIDQMQASLEWVDSDESARDFAKVISGTSSAEWKGHCMYCTHCAPCKAAINIADVHKYLNLAICQDEVPETVREHYNALEVHASDCTECRECMDRCPFGVDIVANMRRAAALFGI